MGEKKAKAKVKVKGTFAGFQDIRFAGNQKWLVLAPYSYTTKRGERIEIPAGFVTDLTSIPRLLWSLYPPHGNYLPAAVVHDYLYWLQDRERGKCDAILGEAMEACEGVSRLTRWVVMRGVRIGGWASFRGHKANKRVRDAAAGIVQSAPGSPVPTLPSIDHNSGTSDVSGVTHPEDTE